MKTKCILTSNLCGCGTATANIVETDEQIAVKNDYEEFAVAGTRCRVEWIRGEWHIYAMDCTP